jgi:hypothetical protein
MREKRLSENFTLAELVASDTAARMGLIIEPTYEETLALTELCRTVLQPIRDALGPVYVTSGLRPAWLNTKIGGSPNSQHMLGRAADIKIIGRRPIEVARWIESSTIPFDQCIHEFGEWVHVSVAVEPGESRRECWTAVKIGERADYITGIREVAA